MDTNLLISIGIAIVAIVPAMFALVKQLKNDSDNRIENIQYTAYGLNASIMEVINGLQARASRLEVQSNDIINSLDETDEKIWARLYEKPVIVRCDHCNSANVITNLECTQCGAPLK